MIIRFLGSKSAFLATAVFSLVSLCAGLYLFMFTDISRYNSSARGIMYNYEDINLTYIMCLLINSLTSIILIYGYFKFEEHSRAFETAAFDMATATLIRRGQVVVFMLVAAVCALIMIDIALAG
jgi:hypothetical protein